MPHQNIPARPTIQGIQQCYSFNYLACGHAPGGVMDLDCGLRSVFLELLAARAHRKSRPKCLTRGMERRLS